MTSLRSTLLRVFITLLVGFSSACVLDLSGAPCSSDDNCPRNQFCDLAAAECRSSAPSADMLRGFEIAAPAATLPVGEVMQLAATALYGDGSKREVTGEASWSSSDARRALMLPGDPKGRLKGISAGSVEVSVSFSGVTAVRTFEVADPALVEITVTPQTPVLAKGQLLRLAAVGRYTDGTTADVSASVTWSSSAPGVASVDDAAATGGQVATHGIGTTVITAELGSRSGSTTLVVVEPVLTSISLGPAAPLVPRGSEVQFVAMGHYSDDTTRDVSSMVSWSSSDPAIASVANDSGSKGQARAVADGKATISANLGGVIGSTELIVVPPVLTSISLTPTTPVVAGGTIQQFIATGIYSDQTNADITSLVTWSSADQSVATVSNSPGSKGRALAKGSGQTLISAGLSSIVGGTTLTVTTATLSSLEVTPTEPSLPVGTEVQLLVTGTFSDGSAQDLTASATWSSSSGQVATVSNAVGSKGVAAALSAGTTTASATVLGVTASTLITVTAATLSSIAVTPANASLAAGTQQQFNATGTYSDGSTADLTQVAGWASSVSAVATVSGAGLVQAVGAGSAVISATHGSITGSTPLAVTALTLSSISISPSAASIAKGVILQFAATGHYSDGSTQDLTGQVTWSSSDTVVATISNASGSRGQAKGQSPGSATLSAALGGVTGTAALTVTGATLSSVSISPSSASVPVGLKQQFSATGTFSDNSTQDLTQLVTWSSSNGAVAAISNAAGSRGLATALAQGSTTVSAMLSGKTGSAPMTVTAPVITQVSVTPVSPQVPKGLTQQFMATALYSDGTSQDVTASSSWTSGNPGIATVSNTAGTRGKATAISQGSTSMSATIAGLTGAATITVTAPVVTALSVTPKNPSVVQGGTQQFTATATLSDGTTQDVTPSVIWTSSDTQVATIDSSGAASALNAGTTTISATYMGFGDSTVLTVTMF